MFEGMSFDQAHVLMDAIGALRAAISNGTRSPWVEYDSDGIWPSGDPKLTESGYHALLQQCEAALNNTLGKG